MSDFLQKGRHSRPTRPIGHSTGSLLGGLGNLNQEIGLAEVPTLRAVGRVGHVGHQRSQNQMDWKGYPASRPASSLDDLSDDDLFDALEAVRPLMAKHGKAAQVQTPYPLKDRTR
jgi:hypothetical protein